MEVFSLGKDDVERAREQEDIIQFALRGALRRAGFDGIYSVYLYSLDQAEMLATYLAEEGLASVQLAPVEEAGIMDVARVKTGRPNEAACKEVAAEKKRIRDRRVADAQRKREKRAGGTEGEKTGRNATVAGATTQARTGLRQCCGVGSYPRGNPQMSRQKRGRHKRS